MFYNCTGLKEIEIQKCTDINEILQSVRTLSNRCTNLKSFKCTNIIKEDFHDMLNTSFIYIGKRQNVKKGVLINDRYRLDACLGAGSYGQGWKATDMRLSKEVFLK